jgi:hypothetical protein
MPERSKTEIPTEDGLTSYEDDVSAARRTDTLLLYQQLGRIEGSLRQLTVEMARIVRQIETTHQQLGQHLVDDAAALTELRGTLAYLKEIVDRIKKPVDAFISTRNFLIGVASLIAAGGAIWAGISYLPSWLGGLFHQN